MKILKRIRLELKSLRGFYWLPVGVLFILLPAAAMSYIPSGRLDTAYFTTVETTQWLSAMAAPWWAVLLMRPFFHSDGKELFLLYNDRRDDLFLRTLCMTGWYLLHILVLMVFFAMVFKQDIGPFLAVVAAQTLFINGLCYFLAVSCRNTFLPVIFTVGYCVIFGLMIWQSGFSVLLMNGAFSSAAERSRKILTALIAGGVFFAGGTLTERRLYR